MNIEDQVVSLELAKKLKEIGVKQESLWKWYSREWRTNGEKKKAFYVGRSDADVPRLSSDSVNEVASAFTVAELMEQLPTTSRLDCEIGLETEWKYWLTIEKKFECLWVVSYVGIEECWVCTMNKKLVDAFGMMLIWLVKNGYVEVD